MTYRSPREYYYTYYSYEEWGRGYIGSRKCYCLPEEDINYLGSSKDKTFKPKYKIILKDDYATREEAYADEIILQEHYKVIENPHFANIAYQTSTKFYVPREQSIKNGKRSGKKALELGVGVFGMSEEERFVASSKGGTKTKKNKVGLFALTKEQREETGRKSAEKVNAQRWECCETGYVSTAAGVVSYQKGRVIDTSKRKRIA